MYYINKIVGVMMSPTVLLMLALIVCAWRLSKRNSRTSKLPDFQTSKHPGLQTFLWLGLVLLWFWMSALPARILGLPLEREWLVDGEIPTAESFPKADAIVCLGGGMGAAMNKVHGVNMFPGADRVWMAARLWKADKAPKIICTGSTSKASTLGLLMDFGVPENAITFLEDARNTEEEAKAIAAMLPSAQALVVTSAWHMRRAKLMFEKYAKGVEIIPAPTDFEATIGFDKDFEFRELLPNANFFPLNEAYLREWIGYVGYKWLRR